MISWSHEGGMMIGTYVQCLSKYMQWRSRTYHAPFYIDYLVAQHAANVHLARRLGPKLAPWEGLGNLRQGQATQNVIKPDHQCRV